MGSKKLIQILKSNHKHWVGDGFHVHTMFHPHMIEYHYTSPFIMMDYAPTQFFPSTSAKRGVGEHPHRGFETVTFALKGEIEHRDSSGGGGVIGTGDVQWMSAASGLVHDEFHSSEFAKTGGDFEMVQLWVNLPASEKMNPPKYQGIKDSDCPRVKLENGKAKIYAGEFEGVSGPGISYTPINLFEFNVQKDFGHKFELDEGSNTLILLLEGELNLGDKSFDDHSLAILSRAGTSFELKAKEDSRFIIFNGQPIDEPIVAHGPFVMNSKEEIIQAIEDFQNGKMGRLV